LPHGKHPGFRAQRGASLTQGGIRDLLGMEFFGMMGKDAIAFKDVAYEGGYYLRIGQGGGSSSFPFFSDLGARSEGFEGKEQL